MKVLKRLSAMYSGLEGEDGGSAAPLVPKPTKTLQRSNSDRPKPAKTLTRRKSLPSQQPGGIIQKSARNLVKKGLPSTRGKHMPKQKLCDNSADFFGVTPEGNTKPVDKPKRQIKKSHSLDEHTMPTPTGKETPAEDGEGPMTPINTKQRKQQVSAKRQQKIQQFLKQGSFARRTWDETPVPTSPSLSAETSVTVATAESSSSLSSCDDDDDLILEQEQEIRATPAADVSVTPSTISHKSSKSSSSSSSKSKKSSKPGMARSSSKTSKSSTRSINSSSNSNSNSNDTYQKRIRWDGFVERDQKKRTLTRQFRNKVPDWKQRQMAHRVHYCNQRKRELEEFQREYLEKERKTQEIQVGPAGNGWFERDDRHISAEFLAMDDIFAPALVTQRSVASMDPASLFAEGAGTPSVGDKPLGARSVASF